MLQRIISAIVLIIIFVPLIIMGNLPYAIMMLLLAMLGLYELLNVRESKKKFPLTMKILAFIATIILVFNHYELIELSFLLDYRLIVILLLMFILPIIIINNSKEYNLNDALFLIGSILFIGLSFNLLILIRNHSIMLLVYIFLITTMTDTFAYLTGRYIGKHKMAPTISPNKTVEGLIGGLIMGVFISSMFYYEVINPNINIVTLILVTTSLSFIAELGDLVFSAIKRYYNKKDFSNLIPGHGGILDRLDSIIFVVLAFILFINYL